MYFNSIYTIKNLIGSGFKSNIYLCVNKKTKEKFACKIVKGNHVKKSFFDENNSQMCNHPNINTIHGVYYTIENGKYNKKIISELGNGDLFEFVQTNNISEKFAKNIIKQMAFAIEHIHEKDICHRDIKLENFIYTFNNDKQKNCDDILVKMIDFEFSRQFTKDEYITGRHGTPAYAAPELMNFKHYNHKIDIWSLGICAYMLLSYSNPIDKQCWLKTGKFKINIDYDSFEWKKRSKLSKDFVNCLLQTNPNQRYNIKEVLNHEWLTA